MTSFWDTVLYPVLGEAVPWLVVLGLPALIFSWCERRKASRWHGDYPHRWRG